MLILFLRRRMEKKDERIFFFFGIWKEGKEKDWR